MSDPTDSQPPRGDDDVLEAVHRARFATDADVTIPPNPRPPSGTVPHVSTLPFTRPRDPWLRHQWLLLAVLTLVLGLMLGLAVTAATNPPARRPAVHDLNLETVEPVVPVAFHGGIRQASPTGFITGTPIHLFGSATYQTGIGPIELCGYAGDQATIDAAGVITYAMSRVSRWCPGAPFAMNQNLHAELWFQWTDGVWYKHPVCSTIGAVGGYAGSYTWSRTCAIWGHVPVATRYSVQLWTDHQSPIITEWERWSPVGHI